MRHRVARRMTEREPDPEGDDLRDRLHAMETRIRRMRDQRANHNTEARRFAAQRDTVQAEYKEVRVKLDEGLVEVKAKRSAADSFRKRRDAIQEQLRALFAKAKQGNADKRKGKSFAAQFNELTQTIQSLEKQIETSGNISLDKENKMLARIKGMSRDRRELEPMVSDHEKLEVDLSDTESAIAELKMHADAAHLAMVDALKEARKMSKELQSLFDERDFLKAEGDRHHQAFVEEKQKADEVHAKVVEMMKQVTEVKGQISSLRKERKSWLRNHNRSVRDALTSPDEDEALADSLVDKLLAEGNLSLGGTLEDDVAGRETEATQRSASTRKSVRPSRGRRSTVKKV